MKWCVYILCIIFFSNCVSLKQTKQTGIKKVENLNSFNGTYENLSNTERPYSSLWNQLRLTDSYTSDNGEAKVELIVINKNQIRAILTQNNQIKSELILKGKLRDNYFVSNSRRTIIPIPFIYGDIKNNQFQLALSESNSLLVDRLNNQWGWVFFFLASNDQTKHNAYKSIMK